MNIGWMDGHFANSDVPGCVQVCETEYYLFAVERYAGLNSRREKGRGIYLERGRGKYEYSGADSAFERWENGKMGTGCSVHITPDRFDTKF